MNFNRLQKIAPILNLCEINIESYTLPTTKILSFFLLGAITLTNGLLSLYQIIVINRAAKKIEQAWIES